MGEWIFDVRITVDVRRDVPVTVMQSEVILKNCDLTYRYGAQNNL